MTQEELIVLARQIAATHNLDPALVCAICHQESAWYSWAMRAEPGFYKRYIEGMSLDESDKWPRAISYGLMQIMGQTGREFGFKAQSLGELLDPIKSLEYGCLKLKRCLDRHQGNIHAALLEYNGGANLGYPGLVLARYDRYKVTR